MGRLAVSAALQRNLARKRKIDPDVYMGYLTGTIPTKPASKVPTSPFEGLTRKLRPQTDRDKAMATKRKLGGSSGLPDTIRHCYTEGERAALVIVAFEVRDHGYCDLALDVIARRAGVKRTTVQNALRRAATEGHVRVRHRPRRGRKSLTNFITITLDAWVKWLKRMSKRLAEATGFKKARTKETEDTLRYPASENLRQKCSDRPPDQAATPQRARKREDEASL